MRTTTLPGGLRVVTEAVPGSRSAAFGVWVGVGSRDEQPAEAGASHFLEHLLFKGTSRRDAFDISSAMDGVGGELNAFTAKEFTCYHARVVDSDLPLAVDVVTDLVTGALVAPADVESERGVIAEEIAMQDDDPGEIVHEVFERALFGGHPLGLPVIGSSEGIEVLSAAAVAGYYRSWYTPDRMVVSAAGHIDHDELVALTADAFALTDSRPAVGLRQPSPPVPPRPAAVVDDRATEQAHIVLGTTGLAYGDDRRHALWLLNNALGEGMSSRLFQEVREKRGLAYSVYSYTSPYADTGVFGLYAGCAPARVDDVLELLRDELDAVAGKGITDEELVRAKGQERGSLVLDLEDSGSRMSRIGKSTLVLGGVDTVDEELARFDAVTPDDVREVAADVLRRPLALGVVGPFADRDFLEAVR